jgi:hypothetical protein
MKGNWNQARISFFVAGGSDQIIGDIGLAELLSNPCGYRFGSSRNAPTKLRLDGCAIVDMPHNGLEIGHNLGINADGRGIGDAHNWHCPS